ncbi:hypothetical protein CY35_20G017300 [Sphagnum magellanicum]|nr:hypothetical protein CY35_20G017300 [Sphagnum magellanicum]
MPTIQQLIRNRRQLVENTTKSPALRGCPQRRGVCTRIKQSYKLEIIQIIDDILRLRHIDLTVEVGTIVTMESIIFLFKVPFLTGRVSNP